MGCTCAALDRKRGNYEKNLLFTSLALRDYLNNVDYNRYLKDNNDINKEDNKNVPLFNKTR